MEEYNILFTSAGRRVTLIRHFKQTLKDMGMDGIIVTSDLSKHAPASFVGDVHELVPRVSDPNYIEVLLDICVRHKIKLLVPLIDTELFVLSCNKEQFERVGTVVLVSSPEVNEICSDKRNTYVFFKEIGVSTPKLLDENELLSNTADMYPVFLKPANGSSSQGATKINNSTQLEFFLNYTPEPLIQEYVVGTEFTLDILADFNGNVRCVVPRQRMETRAGEVSKGVTIKNREIMDAGKKVVESLPGAVGCITVQCFLTPENDIEFIEINPRFGGGFPLSIYAGADYPRWIIQLLLGQTIDLAIDDWKEGVVMLRYDSEIIVDKEMIS